VKTRGIIVATFCMILLSGTMSLPPLTAQNTTSPQTFAQLRPWNPADETTFAAAIQQVVEKNSAGVPAGLNLLMSGSQQPLYINVGPRLGNIVKQSLTPGQVIRVTGIVRNFNGQNYLLARELQIGDQKIEVRNEHGFLIYPSADTGPGSSRTGSGKFGGAR
jgi:hypothetical protein